MSVLSEVAQRLMKTIHSLTSATELMELPFDSWVNQALRAAESDAGIIADTLTASDGRSLSSDGTPINYMSIAEFRALGFLQEVNRLVLHPCGLALEAAVLPDGTEVLKGIWDYRGDPEGIAYIDTLDPSFATKAKQVALTGEAHYCARTALFGGNHIQPLGWSEPKKTTADGEVHIPGLDK